MSFPFIGTKELRKRKTSLCKETVYDLQVKCYSNWKKNNGQILHSFKVKIKGKYFIIYIIRPSFRIVSLCSAHFIKGIFNYVYARLFSEVHYKMILCVYFIPIGHISFIQRRINVDATMTFMQGVSTTDALII